MVGVWANQLAYSSMISDSILFQFLMYAVLLLLVFAERRMLLALAGLVAGFASLVRPYGILLPLLFVIVRGRRESWSRLVWILAITYGVAVPVLVPWTLRNYAVFGAF